ncbi:MAG TPA: tRNA pseudouridine(38-40) synthase TruA [Ktedonobacteraceae bacterium]|jgi:tRNA pseudouridine38-40 synthase|nr:tRNA pseudouridine(38-40) synthase TruA [Ktedonobacteraceae bacterium]
MRKLACGIEYDGTGYHGFQRQAEAHGRTIQGTLEEAIARISGMKSVVYGAGRTDAGVHASGQVIHFSTEAHLDPQVWLKALNALLPSSIAVRWTQEVPEGFHARYSARSRSYRYTIWNDSAPTALLARYSYFRPQALDVDLMQAACRELPGRKDFGAFGSSPDERNPLRPGPHSCVRTMFKAECIRQDALIYCDFTADAFLTGQVRRMVGTLLLVGQKRLDVDEFALIVRQARKTHPGPAAPSHGLCLVGVSYPEEFHLGSDVRLNLGMRTSLGERENEEDI